VLKIYLITIGLFYLTYILKRVRCYANKEEIKPHNTSEKKWFVWIRFIIIGFTPILNVLMTMFMFWLYVLASKEQFLKIMNGKS